MSHPQIQIAAPQSPTSTGQLPPCLLPTHLHLTGSHLGLGREKGIEKRREKGKCVAW